MIVSQKTRRHQELRRFYEAARRDGNVAKFASDLKEAFNPQKEDLSNRWSIRLLFENFVSDGLQVINEYMRPSSMGGGYQFQEAAGFVDTGAFANIIGQWAYSATLQGYQSPDFVGDQLVTVVPTEFNGERIPGVGRIGDDAEVVQEGNPYPTATFLEEYVETPATIKRGLIYNVTKEAIYFDRTGLVLQEAQNIGKAIQISREKRILDMVCGITTSYRRNGGSPEATYGSDNTQATNALADWTNLNTLNQLFNVMTDPTNGEPIMISPDTLVVPKALEPTANRIANATMVRHTSSSSNINTYTNGNQLQQPVKVVSGQYIRNRTSSDTTYFYGRPKEAFVYMQNWPLTIVPAPENNELSFTSDVVYRIKASERGAAGVRDRRYMAKSTA